MSILKQLSVVTAGATLVVMGNVGSASAVTLTSSYGDNDGFGVGQTSGNLSNPGTSNQAPGEAPFTDQRLIGDNFLPDYPAFRPTGGFNYTISPGSTITSATFTLRTGSFARSASPVDGQPNKIVLGGLEIPSSFINGFSSSFGDQIETRSVTLDSSFFPLLTSGSVSLAGTHLAEASGAGVFQVDFARLDLETSATAVPFEFSPGVGILALGALGAVMQLKNKVQRWKFSGGVFSKS